MTSQIAVRTRRGSLSQFRITVAFALALVVLVILGRTTSAEARPVQANIVVDVATGQILQASNADTSTYPASLTKMMTLYLLFEAMQDGRVKLTDTITFSKYAASQAATNLNVRGGDRISVETAVLALVVRSANDVATAVAEHLGGTESGFAKLMTNRAKSLGMSRTTFRNANGLPDSNQRTTARDMATLSVALIRDFPQYYGYFKRTSFKYRGVTYAGHNKLLKSFKGYDGIKTGYIRASGFNLASSAERDGRRLVVVVLGGSSPSMRDRQVADLLTDGFKTARGTGTLLAAKAPPLGGHVKAAAPAPADTTAESMVEDVIANILIKPAQADTGGTIDESDSAVRLAGIKGMMPLLKPGTRSNIVTIASAAAPDSQATTMVWKPAGDYGIQVGAYSKYNAAQQAAQTATKSEAELLADARIIIDTQKMNNGSKLYRARVAGLSKSDAQIACRNLQAKRTDCLVLKIDPALAMGN
ncbi:D-alanyl-D-alanine carboxypeptidase family protein [Dongia deserti]|uniref:D-alanyl-D-alanine carboxypeptidase family protein n=1 Tax=Dongia deserti TaxID=2268030 RepID=UPI000E64DBA6|nr:D-alanyl-D-alanine carboxypeptidase [Dongia deserti]